MLESPGAQGEIVSASIGAATPYSPEQVALLAREYDRCWPWLSEALAHGGNLHSRESLWRMLVEARAHLWPEPDAAGVTLFEHYPNGIVCKVWLAGGNLETIIAAERPIGEWAKANGATHYQIDGRPGWARALQRQGWERTATTIMRRL